MLQGSVFFYRFLFILGVVFPAVSICQSDFHVALENVAVSNELVGMAVVVSCGETILDEYYFGQANTASETDFSDQTKVRIASISKYVTAAGLMKLHGQNAFELDDDVSETLGFQFRNPAFPKIPITFRMLLNHQSSLQDGDQYASFLVASIGGGAVPNLSELVVPEGAFYATNQWRSESPGSYFQYSNANFVVVATLIEALSEQRFDVYMKNEILVPLGISGSFNLQDLPDIDLLAACYRNNSPQVDNLVGQTLEPIDLAGYVPGTNGSVFAPQGGLRASALELASFLRMQLNFGVFQGAEIIDSVSVARMHDISWSFDGENGNNYYGLFNEWGLGVHRTTDTQGGDVVIPNYDFMGHAGEAYGLISDAFFNPETKLGIVFLTNGYSGVSNYGFGTESAFYVPEEQTYQAIAEYWLPVCEAQTSAVVEIAEETFVIHDSLGQRLVFDQKYIGEQVVISTSNGRGVFEGKIAEKTLALSDYAAGVYIVRLVVDNQNLTKKIYIN